MGLRWGLGVLLGIGPIILYFTHDNFRDFVNETIDSIIVGVQNGI
jgi:hypothetical protein